ncbi:TrlF family AAA-like ATPase [Nocardiopsis ganjiahuensis]|uniref:TrlF family AAA-like ATPase n=1 Tax=Nocardiopsis ganjiahuensis TaxID=239984 RepID=UPI000347FACB|nr:chromosome segregation protein SMC [Nocardiopsis ganjiahuensis]
MGIMKNKSGTQWGIWDLHVHTPSSIVQDYGPDNQETWDKFLDDLESLPKDVRVIGINDYWFLEGYKKVIEARSKGRLQNLYQVFPVVEMRIPQFGGTDGNLSRVNLHVIFDPEIPPETIESQFIAALSAEFRLNPFSESYSWKGIVTPDAFADIGRKIKASVPESEVHNYGADAIEGFNNFNVPFETVQKALEKSYFQGRAILGIGKTEWADVKWNNQSIAAKKSIINSSSLVFTAFKDISTWRKQVEKLRASNVNHRLLDCSDAHHFSDSKEKDRIGSCHTWMNTTPTFAGLVHALEEFDRRVYVGNEPPNLTRIRKNPDRFISNVSIRPNHPIENPVFDYEVPLNSGFVAVVGNKGQGKSALLDCIALAGNSSRQHEFAFLNPKRFLNSGNRPAAREYSVKIHWASGTPRTVQLDSKLDYSSPVSVEYLPQSFVERVCSSDPLSGDADEFEKELRDVLFTHISKEDRAGETNFDALLRQKSGSAQDNIDRLRSGLRPLIASYVDLTQFRADNHAQDVDTKIFLKNEQTNNAKSALNEASVRLATLDANSREDEELEELREKSRLLDDQHREACERKNSMDRRSADMKRDKAFMENVTQEIDRIKDEVSNLNLKIRGFFQDQSESEAHELSLTVTLSNYETWFDNLNTANLEIQKQQRAMADEIKNIEGQIKNVESDLASADAARERARQEVLQAEEYLRSLIGSKNDQDSLLGLEHLKERIAQTPSLIDDAREALINHAGLIHNALYGQLFAVQDLYEPASRFIADSSVVKNAGLQFKAELRILPSWRSISSSLDGRRNGDFPEWLNSFPNRVESTDWEHLGHDLKNSLIRLEHEKGDPDEAHRNPKLSLRTATSIEDFLTKLLDLTWLEVRFGITGDGLPLSQLSPGQRGLILALFYLVVDRRNSPLILDQPEENLDNATIASLLVPAIHEAAGRRQTIVVTHNANLAVVGDADQIIHCQADNRTLSVSSGCISEVDVARFAVDVLEGTKPAFDNRKKKYEAFPMLM